MVLIVTGALAALFGAGVIGGSSGKSAGGFVKRVNENVLRPLGQADETAARNAGTSDGAFLRATDGDRIVRVSDQASGYLRTLRGLSAEQQRQLQLLLAFVAANRLYGQALGGFAGTRQDQLALEGAATGARVAITTLASRLSTDLRLPSQTAFISLRATPQPPPSPTPTNETPPASDSASLYVRQVDGLLRQSHAVVLALNSFVRRAARDAISRSDAVALARAFADKRRLELAQAHALTVPSAFAQSQRLLISSLQASAADDQALVAWTTARRDGSGSAPAMLTRANRIGAEATALKRQFLRVYAQQRQTATGLSPAGLPNIF